MERGLRWYDKAASQGDAAAQIAYAILLRRLCEGDLFESYNASGKQLDGANYCTDWELKAMKVALLAAAQPNALAVSLLPDFATACPGDCGLEARSVS